MNTADEDKLVELAKARFGDLEEQEEYRSRGCFICYTKGDRYRWMEDFWNFGFVIESYTFPSTAP